MSSKPWRDQAKRSIPSAQNATRAQQSRRAGPLVSLSLVSAPAQRKAVTALFALLQALKLSSEKTPVAFLPFSILDILFLSLLPLLAVPGLNYKKNVILTSALLLCFFNYTVFISGRWLIVLLGLIFKPLFGLRSTPKHPTGLISGQYVVDILPEASASMDAIETLCISASSEQVYLRLRLNSTWPSLVYLRREDLDASESFEEVRFSKNALRRFPHSRKPDLSELYLPISTPGAYYLDRIQDEATGSRVPVQSDRIVIAPCPDATIRSVGDPNICTGSEFITEITTYGIGPFKVQVDDRLITLGPETNGHDVIETLTHRLAIPATPAGDMSVALRSITDKFGSEVDLQKSSRSAKGRVLSPPYASTTPTDYPLVHGESQANLLISGGGGPFEISVDGPDGPFKTTFKSAGAQSLRITKPGLYKLKTVAGKYCQGSATGSFTVFTPPSLDASVRFEVEEANCVGPTGMNAHLSFEGTAPFKVRYRSSGDPSRIFEESFQRNEGVVQFRPAGAGEYTYEIISVSDRYGEKTVSGSEFRAHQRITELPGASFAPLKSKLLCGESKVTLGVLVSGKSPLTVRYTVDDIEPGTLTAENGSEATELPLSLDFKSGVHYVRLLDMTDGNGCIIDLNKKRTPDIVVRRETPRLSFIERGERKSAEPVNMQLHLKADYLEYPATVKYEHLLRGKSDTVTVILRSPTDSLPISQPGTYKLVSVKDSECPGVVDDSALEVGLYERPRMELVTDSELATCHASSVEAGLLEAKVRLFGESPFIVLHETEDPQGKSYTERLSTDESLLLLSLSNHEVGEYRHYLYVVDSRYDEFNNKQPSLFFTHQVWEPSDAVFVQSSAKLRVCEGDLLSQSLPVVFKGEAPFQLTVEVGNKHHVLSSPRPRLDLRHALGAIDGRNTPKIRILEVSDAHGCRWNPRGSRAEARIEIKPRPVPVEPGKLHYCIGEKITIPIRGEGDSFKTKYSWRNRNHTSTSNLAFERYGDKAGTMSLLEISDEFGCKADSNISVEVHPFPRSTIVEQPHLNIHRGESVGLGFSFTGTPPFSFEYIRSFNGKEMERHKIENVVEHTYSITVEDKGVYEIIQLSDKYCRSER